MPFRRIFRSGRKCEHACGIFKADLPPAVGFGDGVDPVYYVGKRLFENTTASVLRITYASMSPRVSSDEEDEDEGPLVVFYALSVGRRTGGPGTPEVLTVPGVAPIFVNRPSGDVILSGSIGRCPHPPSRSVGTWYLQVGDTLDLHAWVLPNSYPEGSEVLFATDVSYMISYG